MFPYDVLIEKEDICNYHNEIEQLVRYISQGEKVVLFAPRRYGKTSILVNVLGKNFIGRKKNSLFCYVNLQEAKDLHSISIRLTHALEGSLTHTFPIKSLLSSSFNILKHLRPQINVDPLSGQSQITFAIEDAKTKGLNEIFQTILKLSQKYPLFLALDEFQDVAFIPEAEALFRDFVQRLGKSPVIISGSKKHILKDIFLSEEKPFYNWGKRVELKPIPLEIWKPYTPAAS